MYVIYSKWTPGEANWYCPYLVYYDEARNVLHIIYNIFFIFRVDRQIAQKLL